MKKTMGKLCTLGEQKVKKSDNSLRRCLNDMSDNMVFVDKETHLQYLYVKDSAEWWEKHPNCIAVPKSEWEKQKQAKKANLEIVQPSEMTNDNNFNKQILVKKNDVEDQRLQCTNEIRNGIEVEGFAAGANNMQQVAFSSYPCVMGGLVNNPMQSVIGRASIINNRVQPGLGRVLNNSMPPIIRESVKKTKPNPILVADEFAARVPFRIYGGVPYIPKVLEPASGFKVFVPMTKRDVQGELNIMYHAELVEYQSVKFVDEVYDALLLRVDRDVYEPDVAFMKHNIFFRNGRLDLRTGIFSSNNLDGLFFNTYLDINYSAVPVATPCFDAFIHQISGGDVQWQQYLLEILGCCITNDFTSIKGLFVFQGKGNTGKTKLLTLLQKLFPPVFRANLKLREFGERFGPGMLAGKAINIGDENTGSVNDDAVNMLKAFTSAGGTEISVERKYHDKMSIPARCHLIFATNEYLRFDGATDAFLNRIFVLPFQNTFHINTGDLTLDEMLMTERTGIVQKLVKAYYDLSQRQFQFSAYYALNGVVDCVTEFAEDYRAKNLCDWVGQNLIYAESQYISIQELMDTYNQSCIAGNFPNLVYPSPVQFAKDLRELHLLGGIFENRVIKKGHGHRSALVNYVMKGTSDEKTRTFK